MKKYIYTVFFLVFFLTVYGQFDPPSTSSRTNSYTLINDVKKIDFDIEKSVISFNFVTEQTTGTIHGLECKISFNPEDPDSSFFRGTAMVNTIDTNNFLRDGHLMWEKFFYKKKHPKIAFDSSQVVHFGNTNYKVIGNLTIKGTTKEVIINFVLNNESLVGKTSINTSDFGINIHKEREKNKLDITFEFPILK